MNGKEVTQDGTNRCTAERSVIGLRCRITEEAMAVALVACPVKLVIAP